MSGAGRPMRFRLAWREKGRPWKSCAFVYREHRDRLREIREAEGYDVRAWDVRPLPFTVQP